jgi:[ribosomal protein S5]-alanine N-acetyltransferase
MSEIRTQRLLLRPPVLADAPGYHGMFADAEVMRYGSRLPHTEMEQTLEILEKTIAANDADTAEYYSVLMDGEFVGGAGIWRKDEIGLMFARRVWGMGIASEAVAAVIAHRRALGRPHITADTDPGNARCLALLARLGFVVTGEAKNTWRIGDTLVDSVYLELKLDPVSVIGP